MTPASPGSRGATPIEESYRLAALYVRDAAEGRHANGRAAMSLRPKWCRRAFAVHISDAWTYIIFSVCIAHTLLILCEPITTIDKPPERGYIWPDETGLASAAQALDILFLLLLLCDVILKMTYMEPRKWWKKRPNQLYALLLGCLILDSLLFAAGGWRPLRTLRRSAASILNIWRVLLYATLCLVAGMVLFAATGWHLFGPVPGQPLPPPPPSAADSMLPLSTNAFSDIAWGFSSTFQLLTTENFPEAAHYQHVLGKQDLGPFAIAYFIASWYLLAFILLAIMTAVIVDSYWLVMRGQLAKEGRKERKTLMHAFALLDKEGKGYIGMRIWERFLRELMPGASGTEARVRFALMDLDHRGQIDAIEFMQIRSQLEMRLHEQSGPSFATHSASHPALKSLLSTGGSLLDAFARVDPRWLELLDICLSTCQFLLLLARDTATASFCFFTGSAIIFAFRAALHARTASLRTLLMADWSRFTDLLFYCVALVLYALMFARVLPPELWAFLPELIITLRLLYILPFFHRALPLLLRIMPIIFSLTVLIVLCMSFFAVIGMEAFAACSVSQEAWLDSGVRNDSNIYYNAYNKETRSYFAGFHLAMLTNVQILITNDWHKVMFATGEAVCGEAGRTRSISAHIYFIVVYYVYQIILYPVLLALATNAFMRFSSENGKAGSEASSIGSGGSGRSWSAVARDTVKVDLMRRAGKDRGARARRWGRPPAQQPALGGSADAASWSSRWSAESSRPARGSRVVPLTPASPETTAAMDDEESVIGARRCSSGEPSPQKRSDANNTCYRVQMLKTKNYRLDGWRRDLMRAELGDVEEQEADDLAKSARIESAKIIAMLQAKRSGSEARPLMHARTQDLNQWARTARRALRGSTASRPTSTAERQEEPGTEAQPAGTHPAPEAVQKTPSRVKFAAEPDTHGAAPPAGLSHRRGFTFKTLAVPGDEADEEAQEVSEPSVGVAMRRGLQKARSVVLFNELATPGARHGGAGSALSDGTVLVVPDFTYEDEDGTVEGRASKHVPPPPKSSPQRRLRVTARTGMAMLQLRSAAAPGR